MDELDNDCIVLKEEQVLNTYGTDYGDDLIGRKGPWSAKKYCKEIKVEFTSVENDGYELQFDLINIEAPIANALRRILIAEIPTIAIDKVYLYQNTSLIQDEVLTHRLGLIPIKADPRLFKNATPLKDEDELGNPVEPVPNPKEGLIFELKVKCSKNNHAPQGTTDPTDLYTNAHVYTKQMHWVPIDDQKQVFADSPPEPVYPDILIAKMRPGQEIEARCHCCRGIGKDHAKFSPVCTATYRLLPEIKLRRNVTGEAAHRLKESFSKGVISIVQDEETGEESAVVKNARKDMCSRNVFRHPDLADAVLLTRQRRHFLFAVESTGALKSKDLVIEACTVMQEKCRGLLELLEAQI